MKLIRFNVEGSVSSLFGIVVCNKAVPFTALQRWASTNYPELADSQTYLAGLPNSEWLAKELLVWAENHLAELGPGENFPIDSVHLLEPIEVAALYDFGLTPRHLKNSA